jgi:HTH-type transcriptional regulator / antitoxin HigA
MGATDLQEIQAHCAALCAALPLGGIRSKAEYNRAIDELNLLLDAGGAAERHPLALAGHQPGETLAAYAARPHPQPELSPADMLRHLMDQYGLKQRDLAELGSQGVVSEILAGKRALNARQIGLLAKRFGVPAGVFF